MEIFVPPLPSSTSKGTALLFPISVWYLVPPYQHLKSLGIMVRYFLFLLTEDNGEREGAVFWPNCDHRIIEKEGSR